MKRLKILLLISIVVSCDNPYEVTYYDNGKIKSKARVTNGIYDGDFTSFYPSGQIKSRGVWKNGIGNGYIERYFESGVVEEKANWKDNKLHGAATVYHPNGELRLSANFSHGCKVGNYIMYHKSGMVSETRLYDEHCNLFYMSKFDPDGSEVLELFYPVFFLTEEEDSTTISFKCKIGFAGEASVIIGKKESDNFTPISSRIELADTLAAQIKVPKNIELMSLFYKFEYIPSDTDSLNEFLITSKILQAKDTALGLDSNILGAL